MVCPASVSVPCVRTSVCTFPGGGHGGHGGHGSHDANGDQTGSGRGPALRDTPSQSQARPGVAFQMSSVENDPFKGRHLEFCKHVDFFLNLYPRHSCSGFLLSR